MDLIFANKKEHTTCFTFEYTRTCQQWYKNTELHLQSLSVNGLKVTSYFVDPQVVDGVLS